jgi:hypothetical protein
VAIVGTAAVAVVVVVAVVVLHCLDMLVADTQEQGEPDVADVADVADGPEDTAVTVVQHVLVVAQQEIVVPCPLDDPVHIASHSNSAILALAALAALASVVVVLRFPLYLLYPTRLMRFVLLFCSCPVPLLWREAYSAFASQAYHNRCVLTSVCVLLLLTRPVNEL